MDVSITKSGRTNVRWQIVAVLFIITTFNYVDRATLSVAASTMQKDLSMDSVSMGLAFSAFGWTYTALQIPGGWLLDRFGSLMVYGVGLFIWSFFTLTQGFVTGFIALFVMRFLVGIAEAPAFPANSRIATMWFPNQERGLATSLFNSAQYFALAIGTPLMAWMLSSLGWRSIFYSMGVLGIGFSIFWFMKIRDPRKHPSVNQAELDYIKDGGGLSDLGDTRTKVKWSYVTTLVCNRQMLGIYIGQFCLTTITWFFLTWFPTYLITAKGMSILKVGFIAAIPALAGFTGGIIGGYWSDWLLRRGKTLTVARKTPIILGMLFSSSIILANYVSVDWLVVAVMSLAFFSKGIGALGWTLVGDTSPKEMVGLSGGIFNLAGNIPSIVTPIVIGYIIQTTHSFEGALLYVGGMGFLGAMSYLFIVRDIHRVELSK